MYSRTAPKIDELPNLVADLCVGRVAWSDIVAKYTLVPPVKGTSERLFNSNLNNILHR